MIAHRDPEGLRVEGPFGRRGITAGLSGPARRRPLSLNVRLRGRDQSEVGPIRTRRRREFEGLESR